MKIVLFLTLIAGLLIAQTKMKPAAKPGAKPKVTISVPPPPRTELTTAEKMTIIDAELQYEKAVERVNDLGKAIQADIEAYKSSHNAKACKGLSPGMQWNGCEPPAVSAAQK